MSRRGWTRPQARRERKRIATPVLRHWFAMTGKEEHMEKPIDRRNVVMIGDVFAVLEDYRPILGNSYLVDIRNRIYAVADKSNGEELVETERAFALRVLRGDVKNAQETEILPEILRILHGLPEK